MFYFEKFQSDMLHVARPIGAQQWNKALWSQLCHLKKQF